MTALVIRNLEKPRMVVRAAIVPPCLDSPRSSIGFQRHLHASSTDITRKNLEFAVAAIARRAFRGWAGMMELLLGFDVFILMENYRERLVQDVEIDVMDAVWFASQCGATDPRNKVSALGGIIRNFNTLDAVRIDYNASYEDVLRNVAKACLLKPNL